MTLRRRCHVLLLLDLDRFTNFNDARGSEMGDRLLCAVALPAGRAAGPARFCSSSCGGNKFGIVLHDLGIDATVAGRRALAFADQIRRALCAPLALGEFWRRGPAGREHGLTLYPQGVEEIASWLPWGARPRPAPGRARGWPYDPPF